MADRRTVNPEVAGSSPAAPALPPPVAKTLSGSRNRRVRTLAFRIVLAAVAVLAPTIARAHTRLLSSSPKAGERLTTSPTLISLRFSEILMRGVSRITLTGPAGDTILLGAAPPDSMGSHTIAGVVPTALAAGSYKVHWVAAGRDGHPERGSFSFTVVGSSPPGVAPIAASEDTAVSSSDRLAGAGVDTVASSEADAVAQGRPMTIARWLAVLALFSVVGAVAFRFAVLERVGHLFDADDPFIHVASVGAATYGLFAAVVLVVATVIKLYGASLGMRDISPDAIVFATGWGWAWLAQMLACMIAILGFAIAHRGGRSGWLLAALAALVLVVTPAATGHAIGSDRAVFAVPLDVVHVLAGSTWLGTLAVILIVGIGAAAKTPGAVSLGARVATMIRVFSPLALICGGTIVATGVAASLLHLQPLSGLWTSWYGKVLIVKLAFVAMLFAVGAWNWRRVKPSLGGDEGVKALRFSAKIELSVAAMVLLVTAFLVALPLPE